MFYLCIPFCLAIIVASATLLPESERSDESGRMDVLGSLLFALFVLLLLLGVKGLDFTSLSASVANPTVWAPLTGAVVAAVVFRMVEKRA